MPLTASEISKLSAYENELNENIHRTFQFRNSGKKRHYSEWSEACQDWHQYKSPLDKFWSPSFKSSVQSGNLEAINELITFLEVDPYHFRSGYLKGRLVRYLKKTPRTKEDNSRIRGIIWNRAGGQAREEFREYCRLASLISTSDFRSNVEAKAKLSGNHGFKFLLNYLP